MYPVECSLEISPQAPFRVFVFRDSDLACNEIKPRIVEALRSSSFWRLWRPRGLLRRTPNSGRSRASGHRAADWSNSLISTRIRPTSAYTAARSGRQNQSLTSFCEMNPCDSNRHTGFHGARHLVNLCLTQFARAYSSTAEQGTHNPLVAGSNPAGPTPDICLAGCVFSRKFQGIGRKKRLSWNGLPSDRAGRPRRNEG